MSAVLADSGAIDNAEDTRLGKNRRGDGLPAELAQREFRLVKLAEAKAVLKADVSVRTRKDGKRKA